MYVYTHTHIHIYIYIYRSLATTVSQLKICDFSGETFKGFLSAMIFYEWNDDTTALQRRVLQAALWHYTC